MTIAIRHYAGSNRPKSNLEFCDCARSLLALKFLVWHFGTFLAFLGEFGLEDFYLALKLFLALFWPFIHEGTVQLP